MAQFITLHEFDLNYKSKGKPLSVNADNITKAERSDTDVPFTMLHFIGGERAYIFETPEEISQIGNRKS